MQPRMLSHHVYYYETLYSTWSVYLNIGKYDSYHILFTKLYVNTVNLSTYQVNTDKFTHILLFHYLINTIRNTNTFQPLKGLLQGV
jgi:hypothetical protein